MLARRGDLSAGQAAGRLVSVVLTGGRTGTGVLRRLRTSPQRDAVDRSHVDVVWSDEGFVGADDAQHNERQAWEALLHHVGVDAARVQATHPRTGSVGDDAEAAAENYDAVLATACRSTAAASTSACSAWARRATSPRSPTPPRFRAEDRRAVAVHDCPKPPATRLSLTLATIRGARRLPVCCRRR